MSEGKRLEGREKVGGKEKGLEGRKKVGRKEKGYREGKSLEGRKKEKYLIIWKVEDESV